MRRVLPDAPANEDEQGTRIEETFKSCATDAERLMLLDMTASESGPQAQLFVDDGRFRASSSTGPGLIADCLTEYASFSRLARMLNA